MAVTARQLAAKTEAAEALLAAFPAPGGESNWAAEARRAARARFRSMGAPGRRDEYWKFTNPAALTSPKPLRSEDFRADETPVFDEVDALRRVFVDGVFRADLSDALALEGVEIQPLSEALSADIHWARDLFGVLEMAGQSPVERPLAALNTAVAREGFAIRVTGKAPRPINLRYLHTAPESDAALRHVVKLEAGADISVLENGPAAARFNKVMEVLVGDGAGFHHVRAQGRDHDRTAGTGLFARLGSESTFKSFTLTVNGRLTRNEVVVEFTGDDAVAHIAGASAGDGDFHHDDTVFVTHDAQRCESRQVFKKVLRGKARGVFQGKILVKPDAQKTDGYQISQALLLSDEAEFNAKPELEIYADDVACSHGSTCGSVDDTALFYLRSRGVPVEAAKTMLVQAFLDEAIQEIEDGVIADVIRARIAAWMSRRMLAG